MSRTLLRRSANVRLSRDYCHSALCKWTSVNGPKSRPKQPSPYCCDRNLPTPPSYAAVRRQDTDRARHGALRRHWGLKGRIISWSAHISTLTTAAVRSRPAFVIMLPDRIIEVFNKQPAIDCILTYCAPKTIYALRSVCQASNGAVMDYILNAFNINDHLRQFTDEPVAFRIMLARTASIVSGSKALEFFSRDTHTGSDVDIFVAGPKNTRNVCRYLVQHGFSFNLSSDQMNVPKKDLDFEKLIAQQFRSRVAKFEGTLHYPPGNATTWIDQEQTVTYGLKDGVAIYSFDSPATGISVEAHPPRTVKARVISGQTSAIELVLCIQSSAYTTLSAYSNN